MKKLLLGAVVAALLGLPGISLAETPSAPRQVAAPAARDAQPSAPDQDAQSSEGEASDYAAREKAAPQLAEFSGGERGIYLGTGALIVVLLVVLILVVA